MKSFSVSISLLISGLCCAAPVVKWQDAQGQWHFGTQASAPKQQATQPVYIEQPMSVVQNSHPLPTFKSTTPPAARRQATVQPRPSTPQTPARLSKQRCDQLRDQRQPRRKPQEQRDAQLYYEQQCVIGRYYADRND